MYRAFNKYIAHGLIAPLVLYIILHYPFEDEWTGDSRNKTRLAKVVVVANSKQKCSVRTHNVVKYTSKNFGYDYTLYWLHGE